MGDKQRSQRWYRQAKETKCGEMAGRESQRPIVVSKRGNGLPDPVERRGCRVVAGSWNHAEDTVPHRRVTAQQLSREKDSDSTT